MSPRPILQSYVVLLLLSMRTLLRRCRRHERDGGADQEAIFSRDLVCLLPRFAASPVPPPALAVKPTQTSRRLRMLASCPSTPLPSSTALATCSARELTFPCTCALLQLSQPVPSIAPLPSRLTSVAVLEPEKVRSSTGCWEGTVTGRHGARQRQTRQRVTLVRCEEEACSGVVYVLEYQRVLEKALRLLRSLSRQPGELAL